MSKVKKTTLGEISKDIQYGYTESASNFEIGPKFLRITDIQNDFINWDNVPYCKISETDFKKYKLNIGDILIARTGNSTGANSVIKKDIKAVFASYLIRFQLKHEIAYYGYIDFILRSNYWKNFVKAIKGGSAQGGANASNFAEFPIFLPNIQDQQKIASVLSTLDSKIELNNKINAELEQMAKTLYDYWFVQFDFPVPKNSPLEGWQALPDGVEETKPYKTSGGAMVYNQELKRHIPKDWEVDTISNRVKTYLGGTPSRRIKEYWENGNISWLSSGEIAGFPILCSIEKISDKGLNNSAAKLLKPGSIMVSITGNIRASILGIEASANQSVVGIEESQELRKPYLYFFILNHILQYEALMTGAVQKHINKNVVDSTLLLIPPKEILEKFYKLTEPLIENIIINSKENQKLAELRDFLLPMLMNGQVTVE
jgi:type I restriction enzyme S subunit